MITQISLRFFKCFEGLDLPLSNLTVLSGPNASGKSSILQAMVLFNQTMRMDEWSKHLMLNGDLINLGTVSDVVDKVSGRFTFEIGFVFDERNYGWTFAGERKDMSPEVSCVTVPGNKYDKPAELLVPAITPFGNKHNELSPLHNLFPIIENSDVSVLKLIMQLRDLTYISAERVGPRDFYPLHDPLNSRLVAPGGEHAVGLLYSRRDEHVLKELAIQGVAPTIQLQVGARMKQFFAGFELDFEPLSRSNAVFLGLRTSPDTDFHRPVHVGFGLTQVMPIVIAGLLAKEGDVLLIENPEVHLHPSGQALMGQFLADLARAGVQVIVETHSDHVLNGIRRSVKAEQLKPEQVALYFFKPRSEGSPQVISPVLDKSGGIDEWPPGFFDQFDKDLNYFAGWGN